MVLSSLPSDPPPYAVQFPSNVRTRSFGPWIAKPQIWCTRIPEQT